MTYPSEGIGGTEATVKHTGKYVLRPSLGHVAYPTFSLIYVQRSFQLGEEDGLAEEGLTLDESQVTGSANVGPCPFRQMTIGLANQSSRGTEVTIEVAYVDPLRTPAALEERLDRFHSEVGYR